MNAAQVQSFVRGEVAAVEQDLPNDAVSLWQASTRLVLVTSKGCRPCQLQKQSMPPDVQYQTVDIERVNAKGYNVQTTPTLMVFVDGELQASSAGLLRGDGLRSFLKRWGFADEPPPEDDDGFQSHNDDDRNPWTNPSRWQCGPIRDRIDNAKDRFVEWRLSIGHDRSFVRSISNDGQARSDHRLREVDLRVAQWRGATIGRKF